MRLDNIPSNNSLQYKTIGLTSSEIKEITVSKTENNVPLGYVAYEHKPDNAINNNVKFKFNGNEIQGFPKNGISIDNSQPFKVYYEKGDTLHERPLFAHFETTGGKHKYYARGNVWWRLIEEREESSALDKDDLGDLFKDEMLRINRRIGFLEFIHLDLRERARKYNLMKRMVIINHLLKVVKGLVK